MTTKPTLPPRENLSNILQKNNYSIEFWVSAYTHRLLNNKEKVWLCITTTLSFRTSYTSRPHKWGRWKSTRTKWTEHGKQSARMSWKLLWRRSSWYQNSEDFYSYHPPLAKGGAWGNEDTSARRRRVYDGNNDSKGSVQQLVSTVGIYTS